VRPDGVDFFVLLGVADARARRDKHRDKARLRACA
jgi:hypothetical protein